MRAKGNGHPQRCAENLLATVRGEVPYERIKGLDARNIDRPSDVAVANIREDADFVISTYEPRAKALGIEVTMSEIGGYNVTASVQAAGE